MESIDEIYTVLWKYMTRFPSLYTVLHIFCVRLHGNRPICNYKKHSEVLWKGLYIRNRIHIEMLSFNISYLVKMKGRRGQTVPNSVYRVWVRSLGTFLGLISYVLWPCKMSKINVQSFQFFFASHHSISKWFWIHIFGLLYFTGL